MTEIDSKEKNSFDRDCYQVNGNKILLNENGSWDFFSGIVNFLIGNETNEEFNIKNIPYELGCVEDDDNYRIYVDGLISGFLYISDYEFYSPTEDTPAFLYSDTQLGQAREVYYYTRGPRQGLTFEDFFDNDMVLIKSNVYKDGRKFSEWASELIIQKIQN